MQIRKNMTKIIKFVYVMSTFLSLFLVATVSAHNPCKTVVDCPPPHPYGFVVAVKCVRRLCIYNVHLHT
ncbi:putative Late nodulin [Medicago truncatula]|nr:putative Late nodulin [Medicago truncatula]